jgi:hypothetical protein
VIFDFFILDIAGRGVGVATSEGCKDRTFAAHKKVQAAAALHFADMRVTSAITSALFTQLLRDVEATVVFYPAVSAA